MRKDKHAHRKESSFFLAAKQCYQQNATAERTINETRHRKWSKRCDEGISLEPVTKSLQLPVILCLIQQQHTDFLSMKGNICVWSESWNAAYWHLHCNTAGEISWCQISSFRFEMLQVEVRSYMIKEVVTSNCPRLQNLPMCFILHTSFDLTKRPRARIIFRASTCGLLTSFLSSSVLCTVQFFNTLVRASTALPAQKLPSWLGQVREVLLMKLHVSFIDGSKFRVFPLTLVFDQY